jgi:imidazoleglycerol-phosphate dehydratase/histidinol-phosphatase
VELAKNLGAKFFINTTDGAGNTEIASKREELDSVLLCNRLIGERFMNF